MQLIDSGTDTAQGNMDRDAALLKDLDPAGAPILHHYDWDGLCATHGYFVKPEQYLNLENAGKLGLSLGRRPTGGGILFHTTDLAFSFFLPAGHSEFSVNTLENYRFVNDRVVEALSRFQGRSLEGSLLAAEPQPLDAASKHFCMAKPTKYDVIVDGRKVGGAAQRRMRQGLLHQGTISITAVPESFLEQVLLPEHRVLEAMHANTFALLPQANPRELSEARQELRQLLNDAFHSICCNP